MNATWKARWLEALRSGQYQHGRNSLTHVLSGQEYDCCLGVMCKLMELPRELRYGDARFVYADSSGYRLASSLSPALLDIIGLTVKQMGALVQANDTSNDGYAPVIALLETY